MRCGTCRACTRSRRSSSATAWATSCGASASPACSSAPGRSCSWGAAAESLALEPAAAHAPGARGARADVRQARPVAGDARRSVSACVDRRVREAAQRRAAGAVRGAAARADAHARAVRRSRCSSTSRRARTARRRLRRCIAPACRTARRSCSRSGGRASARRSKPTCACSDISRAADRVGNARSAALPAGRNRRASSRARSSASSISPSRRSNVERFAKNFADDPYIVIPKIYPAVDERDAAGAGAHRWHSRRRSARRSTPPASTGRCSRRAAPKRS